jgi:putative copper resistance protein D
LDDPFVWVRAIHFASTIVVSGAVFFLAFVAEPALRKAGGDTSAGVIVRSRLAWWVGGGLAAAVVSGALWFLFVTAQMLDLPVLDVLSGWAVWMVLTQTGFGLDWIARSVLAGLLAATLFTLKLRSARSGLAKPVIVLLAAGFVGTLAWAGHATAGSGIAGAIHLAADILHLVAAAAWIGALVPLAVLLQATSRNGNAASIAVGREAVLRFSTLGVASVCTLMATGIINAWLLVGTVSALVETNYGRLLLAKIVLFLLMLSLAAINRLRLTPDVLRDSNAASGSIALKKIQRNALFEAIGGAGIILIVGLLGIMSPAD